MLINMRGNLGAKGGTVLQWLALMPPSKMSWALGSNPGAIKVLVFFVWGLHVLPMRVWGFLWVLWFPPIFQKHAD